MVAKAFWRGPPVEATPEAEPPDLSLMEAAVLRDGAAGATRWAFAALLLKLARDGHCTIVRTHGRRWVRRTTVLRVAPHMDPRACSELEQTVLRQCARHDTLGGFGFAGSTFRRRTLRDVRDRLVERGGLADCRAVSNALIAASLLLLTLSFLAVMDDLLVVGAAGAGLGLAVLAASMPRHQLTKQGARRLSRFRGHARHQKSRVEETLCTDPVRAASLLTGTLPALVLARLAPPRWLRGVARRFEEATLTPAAPGWCRDETGTIETMTDACRMLAAVLRATGAGWFRPDRW